MSTSNSSDAGFTGLEAAIVLIAFVVVAAVFAYVVLGAGILFSEESRSTVHQGIREAGSSITVTGTVYGVSKTPGKVNSILVPVSLTAGSEPIDITTISVRLIGSSHKEVIDRNEPLIDAVPIHGHWSVQERFNADSDHLLEAGEQFILNITPDGKSDCKPYRTFAVEIKPAGRVALRVERTVPGSITAITRL
ncbi:flagellin [Methanoculleus sp. FWC-SCC3]|uniref:Flagellin n=1 Tax=Methanoculleus methanifontis TaxID=2584086 RepID=A0ABT8M145_9EURY|nr:archaellin/type IV pilin N-terminal domain-containing protein [Methanoculleus sp. FWC-SCC3]MDN7012748.1 flagellin [Methanoculleus sp. FWC-SCC3]